MWDWNREGSMLRKSSNLQIPALEIKMSRRWKVFTVFWIRSVEVEGWEMSPGTKMTGISAMSRGFW